MIKSPVYLVPYDFSVIASSALKLSLNLAQGNEGTVYLLHISKSEKEAKSARMRLKEVVDLLPSDQQELVYTKVLPGNLYKSVGITGDILDARLTVMGTHGATGLQRFLGSRALKMVAASSTPYLLLVDEQELNRIETIVMPFSFVQDSLVILDSLVDFARQFQSVIHLVGYYSSSDWKKTQSLENQKLAREFLESKGLASVIVNLPKEKSYEEELADYMYHVRADLIAASYFKKSLLPPPNSFVQVMLDNHLSIPVLTVNGDFYQLRFD